MVGVSGGGPHTLALLASYLESPADKPVLEKVVLVCGVCVSGGTKGMMAANRAACQQVRTYETSLVSRLVLNLIWTIQCFFLPLLPKAIINRVVASGFEALPQVDQAIVNPKLEEIISIGRVGFRQGARGVVADVRRCFGQQLDSESVLKRHFGQNGKAILPEVHIYQGKQDVNVPFSHAMFMHTEVFQKKSKLHPYDQHGHLSLIMEEAKTYIEEAA